MSSGSHGSGMDMALHRLPMDSWWWWGVLDGPKISRCPSCSLSHCVPSPCLGLLNSKEGLDKGPLTPQGDNPLSAGNHIYLQQQR